MVLLFVILWVTDVVVFLFAVEHTLSTGVGGMVLFASEVSSCPLFMQLLEFSLPSSMAYCLQA
jgi:hypothetical protein